jgi:hypothetical protein
VDTVDLLRRYQAYDPTTGRFDSPRTQRDYAALLGIDKADVTRIYQRQQGVSLRVLRGLARAFPAAMQDIWGAILADPEAVADDERQAVSA